MSEPLTIVVEAVGPERFQARIEEGEVLVRGTNVQVRGVEAGSDHAALRALAAAIEMAGK